MITLTVSLQVVPGHLDAFVDAIRTNAERSLTDEPGCLAFDVSQDLADVAEHVVPGSQVNTLARRLFHHHSPEANR